MLAFEYCGILWCCKSAYCYSYRCSFLNNKPPWESVPGVWQHSKSTTCPQKTDRDRNFRLLQLCDRLRSAARTADEVAGLNNRRLSVKTVFNLRLEAYSPVIPKRFCPTGCLTWMQFDSGWGFESYSFWKLKTFLFSCGLPVHQTCSILSISGTLNRQKCHPFPVPGNILEHRTALVEGWDNVKQTSIISLIYYMWRRHRALQEANSGYTPTWFKCLQ